jgi:uncharacterized membrane protein
MIELPPPPSENSPFAPPKAPVAQGPEPYGLGIGILVGLGLCSALDIIFSPLFFFLSRVWLSQRGAANTAQWLGIASFAFHLLPHVLVIVGAALWAQGKEMKRLASGIWAALAVQIFMSILHQMFFYVIAKIP